MAARKRQTVAQALSKVKRDDATFSALADSLADASAKVAAGAKSEVDVLRRGAKRMAAAVKRLSKRLQREKIAHKKADNATNRKAVKTTTSELAKARKAKAAHGANLSAARERHAEARTIAARHKKYATAIGAADRALNKKKPARKRRAKRK